MTRYSHRNGETEPPTVEGWYWWSGTVVGAYAEKGLVNITVPRDSKIQIWPSWCDGWLGAEDMPGQWYGPVVAPWEQPAIPPDVRESIAYLIANSLDEYNVTLPETKRHVDAALAWLDAQEPTL